MSELHDVWEFTRMRLDAAYRQLSDSQLQWRRYPAAKSIAEYLLHVAGAEHFWHSRLSGADPCATDFEARLDRAVMDGFLREGVCPFEGDELSKQNVVYALEFTGKRIAPLLKSPSRTQLEMRLISPIGDPVSGREGMIRLAQHASYHTGQIVLITQDPSFPNA